MPQNPTLPQSFQSTKYLSVDIPYFTFYTVVISKYHLIFCFDLHNITSWLYNCKFNILRLIVITKFIELIRHFTLWCTYNYKVFFNQKLNSDHSFENKIRCMLFFIKIWNLFLLKRSRLQFTLWFYLRLCSLI